MEELNCKSQLVTKQEKKKGIEVMSKQMKPNTQMNKKKGASGITLIALIITIVILIILATITINIAFGDNGLIKRAQQARDLYANESASELDILNQVDEYLKEKIKKATSPDTPVEPVIPYTEVYATLYEDGILGFSNNESNIEGLTPISGKSWDITDSTFSAEWGLDEAPYYNVTTPWFADRESIKKVVFSNEIVPKSVTALFMGCTNLTTIEGIENLNTSNVSSFAAMFDDCISLQSIDVSHFNTSNVTDMYSMFEGYSDYMALTEIIGLEQFDTSKVTDMGYMFSECYSLTTLDLSGFNTSNVTDMYSMFWNCTKLKSINLSSFNTSKVTDMGGMFGGKGVEMALQEIKGIENFDTSNVTNMRIMFQNCTNLTNLNLSNFNTSKVTDMGYMFNDCSSLTTLDLSGFNTSNVTDMEYMFYKCASLTSLNLSKFKTENVTKMNNMFKNCSSLTYLNVDNFET